MGPRAGHVPDIHGIYKRVVDSVAWRHVQMLNTFTADNGNRILVDGWYDNIQPPATHDQRVIDARLEDVDLAGAAERLGVGSFIPGKSRRELLLDTIYGTSLNMDGIWGGLTTPGTAGSIMPHTVTSKHNCRYVPDQDGSDLLAKVRRHLAEHGYDDVEVNVIGDVPWVIADYDTDIAQALARSYDSFDINYPPRVERRASARTGRPTSSPAPADAADRGAPPGTAVSARHQRVLRHRGRGQVYGLAGAEKSIATFFYNYAGKN